MINRNNYEVYLIDYMDGKLDAVQVSELLLFLEQNPDIKEEFEGLDTINIAAEETVSFNRELLKKPTFAEVKESYYPLLVNTIETTISPEEMQQLEKAKQVYPELVKEEQLFRLTVLSPDLSVAYPSKKELKKTVPLRIDFSMVIRVAAAILLLAGGWWYFRSAPVQMADAGKPGISPKTMESEQPIAQKSPTEKTATGSGYAETEKTRDSKEPGKTPAVLPVTPPVRSLPANQPVLVAQIIIESKTPLLQPVKKALQDELSFIPVTTTLAYQAPAQKPIQPVFTEIPEVIYAGVQARKQEVLTEENKPGNNQVKPSDAGWAALSIINRVTGADIKVIRKYDQAGKKTGIEIAANNFQYSSK